MYFINIERKHDLVILKRCKFNLLSQSEDGF